jgi:hypothetical protein
VHADIDLTRGLVCRGRAGVHADADAAWPPRFALEEPDPTLEQGCGDLRLDSPRSIRRSASPACGEPEAPHTWSGIPDRATIVEHDRERTARQHSSRIR